MKYLPEILASAHHPPELEDVYQRARKANEEAEFRADLQEAYGKSPDQELFSAWKSRFDYIPLAKPKRQIHWGLAIFLGIISGLLLWSISSTDVLFLDKIPYLVLLWAPIATIPLLIYIAVISRRNYLYTAVSIIALIIASAYTILIAPGLNRYQMDYLILMLITLPLLCWIAIGIAVMGFKSSYTNRFAFLIKSIDVMIAAGIYLIFGMIFGMITLGMFSALSITPPDVLMRLIACGGIGLITLIAVATMYDPTATPEDQDFDQGLSKFISTVMRLLLPLTLIVLFVYIFVIPFNYFAPFQNRDILIIYNVMQFAIIGLLIGATPFKLDGLSERLQVWMRRGIIAVTLLTLAISLYALTAVIYRTAIAEITLNRTAIIGWNFVNIILLGALAISQFRRSNLAWNERLQIIFSKGTIAYLIWSILLITVLPLIFR